MRPELWEKYDGYFMPYLARRIEALKVKSQRIQVKVSLTRLIGSAGKINMDGEDHAAVLRTSAARRRAAVWVNVKSTPSVFLFKSFAFHIFMTRASHLTQPLKSVRINASPL